jgi:uncharacterized protein YdaU (DUF1376 family)
MSKSPAFQFYVNDFLGSSKVGMMNGAEIGVYFMLLLLDWQEDGFEYDPPLLARWCRVDEDTLTRAWIIVGKCFGIADGRYYNPRLQGERAKQESWRAKCSEGGFASGRVRLKVTSSTHQQPLNTPFPSPTPITTTTTCIRFDEFWSAYPKRAGGNSKVKARKSYGARVGEGVAEEVLLVAVRNFADYCRYMKITGTPYVKMAVTWLSPETRGWEDDWSVPVDDGDELAFPNYPTDDPR